MSVVYKITYPNGKVYIGQDRTNSINYLGSASWYRAKAHSVRAPRPTEARTDVREKLTSLAGRLQPPPAARLARAPHPERVRHNAVRTTEETRNG